MRRLVRRPSPAMIVALIALVAATAGNAIADQVDAVISALKPNSVTGKTVKNGSLTLADFKKSERAKLKGLAGAAGAAGATGAQGPAGTPNGYTKTEVDGAFLTKGGLAADADKLDNLDSSAFVQGGGVQDDSFVSLSASGASDPFLKIPGLGKMTATCTAGLSPGTTYVNDSGGTTNYHSTLFQDGGAGGGSNLMQQGTVADADTFPSGGGEALWILQIQKGSFFSGSSRATVMISQGQQGGKCRIQAQLLGSSNAGFVLFFPPVILP